MEWLFIAGLGVWVWLQSRRIGTLTHKLSELERQIGARDAVPVAPPVAATMEIAPAETAEEEPLLLDQPLPAEEPLLLDTPAPAEELEPLLLDTPVPEASNDADAEAPAAPAAAQVATAPHILMPGKEEVVEAKPAARKPRKKFEQWLAQNGLAWMAGGAFALGAIYLVAVAAEQNWFTPTVQLACAIALGVVLLIASEAARRIGRARPPGHPLIAALLAGAGVLAFYVSAWAAHGVYGMIDLSGAASLLVLCAALLIALSYLHGQALGVLAIMAALLAPALTQAPNWPPSNLTLVICAIGGAGFVLAALRRWSWVAGVTLIGLYFWFASAIADDQIRRALALLSFASLGGLAMAFRPPLEEEAPKPLGWRNAHTYLPPIAISISSVLMIWVWLSTAPSISGLVAGPAWVGAMFVALSAAAVRQRVAPAATFVVAVGALAVGFMAYLQSRQVFGPQGTDFYPWVLFAAAVIVVSALYARPHHSGRVLVAGAGAIGAALLIILAAFSRPVWHSPQTWTPLFTGAALLFIAAWYAAREAPDEKHDRPVDFWSGAAAVLVLIGIEAAIPAAARTTAHAGAALLFACGVAWHGWNGLRFAAITAAAISVAHALSPNLIAPVMAGQIPLWGAMTVLIVTAGLLFGAGYFAKQASHVASGEALGSAGIMALLTAAFLALSWIAVGGTETPRIDVLMQEALRALTLLAAGHIVMVRPGQETGRIARWRGHVLFGLGILYVAALPGLLLNPWWGSMPARVGGPPILDGVLIAFAAPAVLALLAAHRLYGREKLAARIYASAGGAFALTWAVLEVRRLFHGGQLNTPPVGVFEGACYALVFLTFALAVAALARRRQARAAEAPFTQDITRIMRGCAWAGIASAGLILLVGRHPWWGGQDAAATNALASELAVLAQLAAVALALGLGRALSVSRDAEPTRFAAASAAMLFGWSFGHAAIRWLYHFGAMDNGGAPIGLEGAAHALWPLAFVLLASAIIQRAPGRDTTRPYLYDLQAIIAAAVWPTLVFTGLGLWVLFNPWWGIVPGEPASRLSGVLAPATPILAAWLTSMAPRVPHIRGAEWFARCATVTSLAHLLVGATLVVRWLYHRTDMSGPETLDVEMWTYSGIWALFGAAVFALGLKRDNVLLRWSALTILVATAAKVMLVDTAQLAGIVRAGSLIGLAIVVGAVSWIATTYKPKPPPGPGDLLAIKPSARRERRHGRRQRTS